MSHFYTRSQAEKATGKSRATLARYVKQGKLSVAEKNEQGHNLFDPAELARVFSNFRPLDTDGVPQEISQSAAVTQDDKALMQAKIDMLEQRLADKDERIEELKEERNSWKHQAQHLLTDQREEKPAEPPRGWLRKLTGI